MIHKILGLRIVIMKLDIRNSFLTRWKSATLLLMVYNSGYIKSSRNKHRLDIVSDVSFHSFQNTPLPTASAHSHFDFRKDDTERRRKKGMMGKKDSRTTKRFIYIYIPELGCFYSAVYENDVPHILRFSIGDAN